MTGAWTPPAGDLAWIQPRPGRAEYRLERDGEQVASLEWMQGSASSATGTAGGSRWTLRDVGIFRMRIAIRAEGSGADLGVFVGGWSSGGVVRFSDGGAYRWANVSHWRPEWAFRREDGMPVVRFRQKTSGRNRGTAVIDDPDDASGNLPILLILGCYLLVRLDRRADAYAGSMIGGGGSPGPG